MIPCDHPDYPSRVVRRLGFPRSFRPSFEDGSTDVFWSKARSPDWVWGLGIGRSLRPRPGRGCNRARETGHSANAAASGWRSPRGTWRRRPLATPAGAPAPGVPVAGVSAAPVYPDSRFRRAASWRDPVPHSCPAFPPRGPIIRPLVLSDREAGKASWHRA